MKLTQQIAPIAIGVGSLVVVGMISVMASAFKPTPIVEAQEPEPQKIEAVSELSATKRERIDKNKIRAVMATPKNCRFPGKKAICTEIPVYMNARQLPEELIANIPNGRKVMIIETVGLWSHIVIFNNDGTATTDRKGWTLTSWLATVK